MKRFRDKQFARFGPIGVSRIDQIDTELDGPPQNFERVVPIRRLTPNVFAGDAHRPEAKSIDREIAAQLPNGIRSQARRCR